MKNLYVLLFCFTVSTYSLISSVPVIPEDEINPVLTILDDPVPSANQGPSTAPSSGCDGYDFGLFPSIDNPEYPDQYEQDLINEGLLPAPVRKEGIIPYLWWLIVTVLYL